MKEIYFIPACFIDLPNLRDKIGVTDGNDIFINLFVRTLGEEYIEDILDMIIIHELIHITDRNLIEEQVEYISKIIFKELKNL